MPDGQGATHTRAPAAACTRVHTTHSGHPRARCGHRYTTSAPPKTNTGARSWATQKIERRAASKNAPAWLSEASSPLVAKQAADARSGWGRGWGETNTLNA